MIMLLCCTSRIPHPFTFTSSLTLYLLRSLCFPHSKISANYSCVIEMSWAGVGEERIDNDYTWPVPWQLFQLMYVPERSAGLQGGEMGGGGRRRRGGGRHKHNTNIRRHAWHMKQIWNDRDAGVFYMTALSWSSVFVCYFGGWLFQITSLLKMLQSAGKHKHINNTLACVSPSSALNHSCREKVMVLGWGGGVVCVGEV